MWCLLQVNLCDPCLSALKWFVYHARRYTSALLYLYLIAYSMGLLNWFASVCQSVSMSESAGTLNVAVLDRFSPKLAHRHEPAKVKTSSLRSVSHHPFT